MSYMYTASSSFPKVRQEGFHTQSTGGSTPVPGQNPGQSQQVIPAQNAFDHNSIYTSGALFADAYRATPADPFARRYEQQQQQHQQQQNSSLDIHDELSFLHPPTSATSESFQQQQQRPHDIFGVNQPHYPSVSLPHSRPPYARDDFSSTTPASVHNSYGRAEYFPNGGPQHQNNTSETARQTAEGRQPHELQQQQQQQSQSYGMMASALSNSSVVDSFNPGGEQAPATGVTRSRSRSRSKVSASRSRVSKRPSLPAPPHEEDGESPDSSRAQSITRPSAIVIPGGQVHHGHHASHSFSSYHTAGTGHPTSPATWAFSGHSAAGEQLFGQSFGGPGSLGPGQSPTTHSGSPPPTGNVDTATKLALANEKRRKRRESHNAVERRRRDNINEKIQELALLLPEEWFEPPSAGGKNGGSGGGGAAAFGQGPSLAGLLSGTVSGSALGSGGAAAMMDEDSKEVKANKGVILRNSVDYIKNLVQLVQVQRSRNQQLESELAQYRNRFGNVIGGSNGGAGNISLNGSMNQGGISPGGGMQSGNHTDDDTNAMAGYVLADSLNSPEGFDMKNIFGGQTGVGPLDTIGGGGVHGHGNHHGGHAHTLSSGAMSMEGVETSSGQPFGLGSMGASGMMGMGMGMGLGGLGSSGGPASSTSSGTLMQGSHHHNNNNNNMMLGSNNGNGNNGGGLGVSVMMTDKTSPSTGSGEGDEGEDDDLPRGRRTTRSLKQEDEPPVL